MIYVEVQEKEFWHLHRLGFFDEFWQKGQSLTVDEKFLSNFYRNYESSGEVLHNKYGNYDIDEIIGNIVRCQKLTNMGYEVYHAFDSIIHTFYVFRREKALEEGRKIFNPEAPSRLHAIYLSDRESINYWQAIVDESRLYLVKATGFVFESSDIYFADILDSYEEQVEKSEAYWRPKKLTLDMPREYLFQGKLDIAGTSLEII